MAVGLHVTARKRILSDELELSTATLKLMLVGSGYSPDIDDDFVDAGGANDPVDHEISVSGYTPGWSGAGRKTIAGKVFSADKTNDWGKLAISDIGPWTLAAGATIRYALVIVEGGANDTTSLIVASYDVASPDGFDTNGGDFTLQDHADGLIHI